MNEIDNATNNNHNNSIRLSDTVMIEIIHCIKEIILEFIDKKYKG